MAAGARRAGPRKSFTFWGRFFQGSGPLPCRRFGVESNRGSTYHASFLVSLIAAALVLPNFLPETLNSSQTTFCALLRGDRASQRTGEPGDQDLGERGVALHQSLLDIVFSRRLFEEPWLPPKCCFFVAFACEGPVVSGSWDFTRKLLVSDRLRGFWCVAGSARTSEKASNTQKPPRTP